MSKTVYLKYPNENVLFKLTLGKEHDLTKLSPNELKDKSYFTFTQFNPNKESKTCFEIIRNENYEFKDNIEQTLENPTEIYFGDKAVYLDKVNEIIALLKTNEKMVFSKTTSFEYRWEKSSRLSFFKLLSEKYTSAFTYLFDDDNYCWLGATPERLMYSNQNLIEIDSLAGTINVESKATWTEKEFKEQNLVSTHIASTLVQNDIKFSVSPRTEINTGVVKHLLTKFKIHENKNEKLIDLIFKIHPTPAVAGMSQKVGLKLIQEYEDYDREQYAGIIGIYSNKKPKLFVNLRCMKIENSKTTIYTGGGITNMSNPEAEWQETIDKANTLLSIFGG